MAEDTMQPPPPQAPRARVPLDPEQLAQAYAQAGTTEHWSHCPRCLSTASHQHRKNMAAACKKSCALCDRQTHKGKLCPDMLEHYPHVFTYLWLRDHIPESFSGNAISNATREHTGVSNSSPPQPGSSARGRQERGHNNTGRQSDHRSHRRSRSPPRHRQNSSYRTRSRSRGREDRRYQDSYGSYDSSRGRDDRYYQDPYNSSRGPRDEYRLRDPYSYPQAPRDDYNYWDSHYQSGPSQGRDSYPLGPPGPPGPPGYGAYWRPENHPQYAPPEDHGGWHPSGTSQAYGSSRPDPRPPPPPTWGRNDYDRYQDRPRSRSRDRGDQRNQSRHPGGRSARPSSPRRGSNNQRGSSTPASKPAPKPSQGRDDQSGANKPQPMDNPRVFLRSEWMKFRGKSLKAEKKPGDDTKIVGTDDASADHHSPVKDLDKPIDEKRETSQQMTTRINDTDLAIQYQNVIIQLLQQQLAAARTAQPSPSTSNFGSHLDLNAAAFTPASSGMHVPPASQQSGATQAHIPVVQQSMTATNHPPPPQPPAVTQQSVPVANQRAPAVQQGARHLDHTIDPRRTPRSRSHRSHGRRGRDEGSPSREWRRQRDR